jgi:hypothetical protein
MHAEALSGGVAEFDAAVEGGVCPFLNELGEMALREMRTVYEQVDAGDYEALGDLAERLAAAANQKVNDNADLLANEQRMQHDAPRSAEPKTVHERAAKQVDEIARTESVADAARIDAEAMAAARYRVNRAQELHESALGLDNDANVAKRPDGPAEAPVKDAIEPVKHHVVYEQPYRQHDESHLAADLQARRAHETENASPALDLEAQSDGVASAGEDPGRHHIAAPPEPAERDALAREMVHELIADEGEKVDAEDKDRVFLEESHHVEQPMYESDQPSEFAEDSVLKAELAQDDEHEDAEAELEWLADEGGKEPAEIYEDLTYALESIVASPTKEIVTEIARAPTDAEVTEAPVTVNEEAAPLSDIVVTVAEKLGELGTELKEAVAPVLKDAIETIQTIKLLEAEEADAETIVAAKEKLEVLVAEVFEQIGIAYETEDIEQFIAVLMKPVLRLARSQHIEAVVDLEHDGTHEAKRHFAQVVSNLADVEDKMEQLLGRLVLVFCMSGRHILATDED